MPPENGAIIYFASNISQEKSELKTDLDEEESNNFDGNPQDSSSSAVPVISGNA